MEDSQRKMLRNVIAGVVVVIVCIVIFLIMTTPNYKNFKLVKTPFSTGSFSAIRGDSVYSYSGISFYKQNVHSADAVTVLESGLRLPTVSQLFWGGDNGVLLTFTSGGYIGSALDKELSSRNLSWDNETKDYLWYLDFKTSKLQLVSQYSLVSQTAHYSTSTESFYFVRNNGYLPDSDAPDGLPLISYSTKTHTETELLHNVGSASVQYVGPCKTEDDICFSIKEGDTEVLYLARSAKKEKLINDAFNVLSPTDNPAVYIGIRYDEISKNNDNDGAILQATPYYISLDTGVTTKTNVKVGATESILANSVGSDDFYLMEPTSLYSSAGLSYVVGGKDLLGSLKTKRQSMSTQPNAEQTSNSIVGPISRSTDGISMFGDIEDNMYLVVPKDFTYSIKQQDDSAIEQKLKPCLKKYTTHHDYTTELKQFKISISYDENFQQRIKDFASCIDKTDPAAYTGHEFVIVGVEPTSGRFVTD